MPSSAFRRPDWPLANSFKGPALISYGLTLEFRAPLVSKTTLSETELHRKIRGFH
jgi:hypothetical protein